MQESYIRNFCIVAHIDHGKSTLADRLMEYTGTISMRESRDQLLDSMDLERERGITIKLQPVRMFYQYKGHEYTLNLIDTPGHVDFTYEVSRSLAACEGAILIVDATQGVEAQTLTNAYLAVDNNLEILPVINKIDLASADIEETKRQIEDVIGIPCDAAPLVSAKEGIGIQNLVEQIIEQLPPAPVRPDAPFKALIFDSVYDNYKGAISFIKVGEGSVRVGDRIRMMATGKEYDVTEVGVFTPKMRPVDCLQSGEVGYLAASIKNVVDTAVGDTITNADVPTAAPYAGYKEIKPVVFAGIYPADGSKYNELREGLEKLKLNDASLYFEPDVSTALGFGFRTGFLGLLHMDVITQRLEREFDLDLVTTAPSVSYKVFKTDGTMEMIDNPTKLPNPSEIDHIEEPIVKLCVYTPPAYVGSIMELCQNKRGIFVDMAYLEEQRVVLTYRIPLCEILYDFFDSMKSRSRGYASLDYDMDGYQRSDMVRLDILLNGEMCDALSMIVHRDSAYMRGRKIAERLKETIPRQMFEIPIQACIGNKVIARETVKALRKDVLAKCYGGDITRKKKLLEKQKEGKKRMRMVGTVAIPSDAFMAILKVGDEE